MKVGIVGFPGSGKSTIFNALTGLTKQAGAAGKDRERLGAIKVPDPRVERLTELFDSRKRVFAEITFIDVAVRPEGAGAGGGLDPQIIQAMRECEALVLVLRGFANPMLAQPPEPASEMVRFREELILTDLIPLENRRERMKKETGRDRERALIDRCIGRLENGRSLLGAEFSEEERRLLSGFSLLSGKPLLCLLNQEEGDFPVGIPEALRAKAEGEGLPLMPISAKIEMDIATLPAEEQAEFLADLGADTSARDRFIRKSYDMLDLISFLTTGDDESRAWPIRRGTPARKAAGKVHSDIERGFIRAEVVGYDDLAVAESFKQARDRGLLRLEGKTYVVQDGDVINFRFYV